VSVEANANCLISDADPSTALLLHSVTRLLTSQPVRLIHEVQFDAPGSFRIYVLAGKLADNRSKLQALSDHLSSSTSFVTKYRASMPKNRKVLHAATNTGLVGYEELNPFFTFLTIIKDSRFNFEIEQLKSLKGLNALVYADDEEAGGTKIGEHFSERKVGGAHIKYGLPEGGIVVCRPDGYVGVVVPLEESGWKALDRYFESALHR
jgi:hypothetical protein